MDTQSQWQTLEAWAAGHQPPGHTQTDQQPIQSQTEQTPCLSRNQIQQLKQLADSTIRKASGSASGIGNRSLIPR